MGIIYDSGDNWYVEARENSVIIAKNGRDETDIVDYIEIDYVDLNDLENAIRKAQDVRRDKSEAVKENL